MVRQAQKEGQAKAASPEVARVASSIKKSDAKDFASTKHKGLPEKKKMNEEGYDHLRDMGKIPPTKGKKDATTMPKSYKRSPEPKKGKSALDIVKANIRKQYGKGAIMGEDVNCDDRKAMAAQHKAVHNKKKDETGGMPATVTAKNRRGQMQGVDEQSLNELGPNTMRNYIIGATKDVAKRASDPESRSGPKYAKKMSRMDGVMKAGDKLAKKASGDKMGRSYKEEVIPEGTQESGRSNYGKASVRNMRRFGYGGNNTTKENRRGEAISKRETEHKASRGVKGSTQKREDKMKPVKWSNKNNEDNRTEEVLHEKETALDRAKRNIGRDPKKKTCWDGWRARGTKMKGGKSVPNCVKESDIASILARLEKKRISKGGDPEKSPLPSMKKYHADKKKKEVKEGVMGMVKRAAGIKQKPAKKTTGRDAGAIAAKIMRDKEQRKYVSFLPANEEVYTGPKKGDLKGYGSKAFKEYEKNMDPKKRQALKDKATKGMKFTHEAIKYDSKGSSMDYFLGADPKKTKEYKALKKKKTQKEGTSYGLYKGSGKPSGAMKKYLDRKAKMLQKKRDSQSDAAKNNPHFDSTVPSPSGRNKYEHVSFKSYFTEGNKTARMLHKSKTSVTGNISADRGGDEKKNKESRKGLEKDLKKKGIGYTKGVGKYKYDSGETGTEVSYQTSKPAKMSKRKFGKTMRRLGRKHGQESVVTKDKNKPARLHDTESKKPGKSINIGKSKPGSNPSGQGETSGNKVRGKSLPKKQNKGAYHYG